MPVSEKSTWIDTNEKYTFKVSSESNVVKVSVGSLYMGWVSNGDSSGGMPSQVVDVARAFLFEVKPELDPAVISKSTNKPEAVGKPPLGTCCEGMRLVLPRTALLQHRHGIGIMELVNTHNAEIRRYLALKFPKDPDKSAPHAKTTTIALNFCPFCGTRLEGEKEDPLEETEEGAGPVAEGAVPVAKGNGPKKVKAGAGGRKLPGKRGNTTRGSRRSRKTTA